MSPVGTIARRAFLIGSAAILGGVAFGVYAYRRTPENPLLAGLRPGEAAITPFVKITADGVTLITPRADFGQGAYSVQAMLLAEELDIDPHRARLEPGAPSPAYYNGALLAEGAPFPAYDDGWLAESVRGFMDAPAKFLALQVTGGSSTVKDMWLTLRHAGAVARETLKAAAAERLGVDAAELRTEDGAVIAPDGTRLAYTALAAEAAMIEPVEPAALRAPGDWRLIGKPLQRADIVAKSTGAAVYGVDLAFEGMLFATVRANPGLGGAMAGYDAAAASAMRGVAAVTPVTGGVAVIADNTWRAFKAAEAIEIDWAAPPYPASSADMWDVLAETIGDDQRLDSGLRDDGDVDATLASAAERGATVLEAEYRIPYLAHAPLEPMNALVKVEADRVDIWTGTQIPLFVRDHAAKLTGVDPADIHVHVQMMGGSFGARLEDTHVLQTIEIAKTVPGRPVKMTWSREEDMTHDYPRPMQLSRARGSIRDGRVESFDLAIAAPSPTASWLGRMLMTPPGPDLMIVAGAWDQPYAIPHYRVRGYRAPEMLPVSSWRSVGASGNGFLHDGFLDELIHAAGADPLEARLALCHDARSRQVLEAVAEMSGWSGAKLGPGRGRGVAFVHSFGVPTALVVEVTSAEGGIRIDKAFAAAEVGRVVDPINFEAQLSGGVLFGLGHAMNCEITIADHAVEQRNFDSFAGMRLHQTPQIEVRGLALGGDIRGIGEPGVPPAAPALANAIFAATGRRIRELPLHKSVDFV